MASEWTNFPVVAMAGSPMEWYGNEYANELEYDVGPYVLL
jgi:hypothetical protein